LLEAFVIGVLGSATPCLLPLYPAFVAYLASNVDRLGARPAAALAGLVVLTGLLSSLLIVALLVTLVAVPLGSVLEALVPVVNVILIALGVGLLADRNPLARLSTMRIPVAGSPFAQAFVYGFVLGPVALPCAGAFLVALFAIALDPLDTAVRVMMFIAFGLGFGLPLVLLSLVAMARGRTIAALIVRHRRSIDLVAGVVLVALGAWGLLDAWRSVAPTPA